jgi:hypothetical protein
MEHNPPGLHGYILPLPVVSKSHGLTGGTFACGRIAKEQPDMIG